MAKDFRINQYSIDRRNLKMGQFVEVAWADAPNSVFLIIDIEKRNPSYKGSVSLWGIEKDNFSKKVSFDSEQVVRILEYLKFSM